MLDYRDFRNYERRKLLRRRKKQLIGVLFLIAGLIVPLVLFLHLERSKISKFESFFLEGKLSEFAQLKNTRILFYKRAKQELLSLEKMTKDEASPAVLLRAKSILNREKLLRCLFDSGNYQAFKNYLKHLVFPADYLQLYNLLAALASYDLQGVEDNLAILNDEKYIDLRKIVQSRVDELRRGKIPLIFDRSSRVLAELDLKTKKILTAISGFSLPEDLEKTLNSEWRRVFLTIDTRWQKKIDQLFGQQQFRGNFLLAELPSGAVRIAYYRGQADQVDPFTAYYEPASVIKCLTQLVYQRYGTKKIFPFDCPGNMQIEGKIFYDWMKHDRVETVEKAMAVSCNLSFARMAEAVGAEKLHRVFLDFGFERQQSTDRYFRFLWGKLAPFEDSLFELCQAGVGVEKLKITSWHALWLANQFALCGKASRLFLVDAEYNPLQVGYYSHSLLSMERALEDYDFFSLQKSMTAVVNDEQGTLKKITKLPLKVAAKTGTGGKKDPQYDAVIIGYYPREIPRYAFVLFLANSGLASNRAADFLKEILMILNEIKTNY